MDLHVKAKTTKLVDENIRENHPHLQEGQDFLFGHKKKEPWKKIDKLDIKIWNFFFF